MSNKFMKVGPDAASLQSAKGRVKRPAVRLREAPGHTDADLVQRVSDEDGADAAGRLQETREAAARVNRRVLAALAGG
ncbi:MAG: hypothetical protein NXI21_18720 [Alphaproteobacteria bacterium]|nr:hypothetical protein [Alphaproteobacteria bacterium]